MTALVTGFTDQIALLVTNVGLVFVGLLALVALVVLARFVIKRLKRAV